MWRGTCGAGTCGAARVARALLPAKASGAADAFVRQNVERLRYPGLGPNCEVFLSCSERAAHNTTLRHARNREGKVVRNSERRTNQEGAACRGVECQIRPTAVMLTAISYLFVTPMRELPPLLVPTRERSETGGICLAPINNPAAKSHCAWPQSGNMQCPITGIMYTHEKRAALSKTLTHPITSTTPSGAIRATPRSSVANFPLLPNRQCN